MQAHVAPYKKELVKRFSKMFVESPVIGIANMENMPSAQLQQLRRKLRGDVEILMTKKRLLTLALNDAAKQREGLGQIAPYMKGMPAILFTKINPFKVFNKIKQSKSPAPAKPGQIAPQDIQVKAGPTPFQPGPIISELASLGFKTSVENGKIVIRTDHIMIKEGQVISETAASMLMRLDIKPMEIGLDVTAVFENGAVYDKKVLNIDQEQYVRDLSQAHSWALNLAIESAIPTENTTRVLIQKAFRDAKAMSIETSFLTSDNVSDVLARAQREAQILQSEFGG